VRAIERDTFRINLHTLRVMKHLIQHGKFHGEKFKSGTRLNARLGRQRDSFLGVRLHRLFLSSTVVNGMINRRKVSINRITSERFHAITEAKSSRLKRLIQ